MGSAQLKHICPAGETASSEKKKKKQRGQRQYICEMESFDRLLINKRIGLRQSVTHLGGRFNGADSFSPGTFGGRQPANSANPRVAVNREAALFTSLFLLLLLLAESKRQF